VAIGRGGGSSRLRDEGDEVPARKKDGGVIDAEFEETSG
jgi:hypothetical protein